MPGRYEIRVSIFGPDGSKERLGKFSELLWHRPTPEIVRNMIQARFAPRDCVLVRSKLYVLLPIPFLRRPCAGARLHWKWPLARKIGQTEYTPAMIWDSKADIC